MSIKTKNQRCINEFNKYFQHDFRKVYLNHIIVEGKDKHAEMTALICLELRKLSIPYYCRYPLKNGGIVDILLPLSCVAVEVMDSESKERFESKKFPREFFIVPISVQYDITEAMRLIL